MSGVTVRPAAVTDAEDIAWVHVRSWQAAYRGLIPGTVLDGLDPVAWALRWRDRLERPPAGEVALVAVDPTGTVTGFASAGDYRDGPDPANAGEVMAVYVDPPHWGSGAGRALMDAAVTHLTTGAARPVRLWVLAGNDRARRFYERYGFVADGVQGSHPIGDSLRVPTVRYTLQPS